MLVLGWGEDDDDVFPRISAGRTTRGAGAPGDRLALGDGHGGGHELQLAAVAAQLHVGGVGGEGKHERRRARQGQRRGLRAAESAQDAARQQPRGAVRGRRPALRSECRESLSQNPTATAGRMRAPAAAAAAAGGAEIGEPRAQRAASRGGWAAEAPPAHAPGRQHASPSRISGDRTTDIHVSAPACARSAARPGRPPWRQRGAARRRRRGTRPAPGSW